MCLKLVGAEMFKVKHIRQNGSIHFVPKYKLPHPTNSDTLHYNAEGEHLYSPNWRKAAKHSPHFINAVVDAVEKVKVRPYSQVINGYLEQLLMHL